MVTDILPSTDYTETSPSPYGIGLSIPNVQ